MSNTQARAILLLGFIITMPIGIYHRLRARTGEHLDRRQEGWPILLSLRLLGLAFMVGLIAYVVEPSNMQWASLHLPPSARWLGVPIGIATIALVTWMFHTLGHNLTDTVVTRQNASLVTGGPYRWVRHPMYVALMLAVIANTLVADNAYFAVIGAAAVLVVVARTRIEERNLVARFGPDYENYMAGTGRFMPKFWRSRNS
jgi:protein-S-isoprenylcysteine O-methyltransferase Ste14